MDLLLNSLRVFFHPILAKTPNIIDKRVAKAEAINVYKTDWTKFEKSSNSMLLNFKYGDNIGINIKHRRKKRMIIPMLLVGFLSILLNSFSALFNLVVNDLMM